MTLAKSIAGGFPMGAILCSDKILIDKGKHGSTFGGNPLACAAGNAALDFIIEKRLWEEAAQKGKYFADKISEHKLSKVKEIRQIGLMIGIELFDKPQPYIDQLLSEGMVTLSAGKNVLRLLPPLVISYEEIDIASASLIKILK